MATNKDMKCCGGKKTTICTTSEEFGNAMCNIEPGTRLYIGGRYIWKFSDPIEWNQDTPYELYTVVLHNAFTYVSKKAVPAGIEIDNEEFWFLIANPNAQFEELRQMVESYDQRMDSLEKKFETPIDVHLLYGKYTMTLIQTANKNIVIDFGAAEDANRIETMFREYGINHIDYAVCSHFHNDHFQGYEKIMQYCDSSTLFFKQMDCTDQNNEFYTQYLANLSAYENAINNIGATLITPSQGEKFELNENAFIEFWNCNPEFETSYINSYKETRTPSQFGQQIASFNNYSLITRIQNGNSSYVDTGDVETQAQLNNVDFMKRANLVKVPHHIEGNVMGYSQFYDNLISGYACATIGVNDMASEVFKFINYQFSYNYRYATQIRNFIFYVNYKTPCDFTILNGNVEVINGAELSPYAGMQGENNDVRRTVRGAFPPARLHFEDPNILCLSSIGNLAGWCGRGIVFDRPIMADSASSAYGNAPFMQDLRTIFNETSSTSAIYYLDYADTLVAYKPSSVGRRNEAFIYSNFERDDFPNTAVRIVNNGVSRTPTQFDFPEELSPEDTPNIRSLYPETRNFFFNDSIIAVLGNGVRVPLNRLSDNTFVGVTVSRDPNSANPAITLVNIEAGVLQTCENVVLATNTINKRTLKAFINPNLQN